MGKGGTLIRAGKYVNIEGGRGKATLRMPENVIRDHTINYLPTKPYNTHKSV